MQGIDAFLDEVREKCANRSIRAVLANVQGLRSKTNRMNIEACLREIINQIASDGDGHVGGSSASRSISRLRAHRAALGEIIGRLFGKNVSSRAQQEGIITSFLPNITAVSKVMDAIPVKCPPWFTELPIITLFVSMSFVVCSEIQWRVTLGKDFSEQKLCEYLRMQESSFFANFNKSFKKSMLKSYRHLHYIAMTHWEFGVPSNTSGNLLPDSTKQALMHSIDLVTSLDGLLCFGCIRQTDNISKLLNGWSNDTEWKRGRMVLKALPDSENETLFFSTGKTSWVQTLKKLGVSNPEVLGTTTAIYREVVKASQHVKLDCHMIKDGSKPVLVRDKRMQKDTLAIWSTLHAFCKDIINHIAFVEKLHEDGTDIMIGAELTETAILEKYLRDFLVALWVFSSVTSEKGSFYGLRALEIS